mmetsp:Transcript_31210/g.99522  ORF Transcript_31210/g.99522 Transcript_31210/m.99522 type:complete len:709 (+) Transcript_31210:505-2631(+)
MTVEEVPWPRGIHEEVDLNELSPTDLEIPPGMDFGIHSDDDEDDAGAIQAETGFGSVVVVDNLPVVPPEKHDKLVTVVRKIFSQIGNIREGGLWMPVDESSKLTKGFAFIEYMTPQEAAAAKEQTNGYKLDKSHIFKVTMFDDFDKYMKVPDTYAEPETKEYQQKENLQEWMLDTRGRDQFAIRFGDDTEIYWNDPKQGKAEDVYRRSFWTESYVQWSPRGNMLATVHRQGTALWGGPSFNRLMRFSHPGVALLDFSPAERFMITYSQQDPANPREKATVVLNVFDTRSGKNMRNFQGAVDDFATPGAAGVQWPVFKWGGGANDEYFARMGKNSISVYETKSMQLLDKKLKLEGVVDFQWSPKDNIMAVYQPELSGGNIPARVSLIAIPSRQELRQKNLFSVADVKMYWQDQGAYLAVKVDRFTKTKKSTYTGFELFRLQEKDYPMEVLELENKSDKIIAFAWEPKGDRFAVVHGDGPRPDISFYTMKDKLNRVKHLGTLKSRTVNSLFWSPNGRFLVLAGLKAMNGQLEFFDADEMETMATGEHFMATDIDWDPTGRYVATSVTSVHQMENGFNMWSFHGKLVYRLPRDRFFQFLWRPRAPTLLSPEAEADIHKNLKRYTKKYDDMDEELKAQQDTDLLSERKARMDAWMAFLASKAEQRRRDKAERTEIQGYDSDEEADVETTSVQVEEVVDVEEETMYTRNNSNI